ncbi:MAG: ORF6N domain-containing protein [Candidatus Thiodiazotropha sp. (ex Codakia orbicularis)]|nr:ORF6N domain-containing protein [Candidatus Thiodiazotropha sp. (ex Codakia orbicularis)]
MSENQTFIPVERIADKIYLIREEKVMMDFDLAELYGVPTKALNQAVSRNKERFPPHFMFQLTKEELEHWRSQFVTANPGAKMGLRRQPYAFTEHGTLMLSSVLRSERATQIGIAIIDTFIRLREMLATHKELARMVEEHDWKIGNLYAQVERLLTPPKTKKYPIGYVWPKEDREDSD